MQWPSRRYDPVALSHDVIYLKHQFHASGRPPFSRCGRKWLLGGPDVDRVTPQCDIRILIAALILRNAETQDSSVKVDDDIEILGKDFTPQRHSHLRMIAHPSPPAAMGGNAGTSAPAHAAWGNRDRFVSRAAAELCGHYVTGPYRFTELDGASHWLPEQAADQVAALLAEHFAATPRQPGMPADKIRNHNSRYQQPEPKAA